MIRFDTRPELLMLDLELQQYMIALTRLATTSKTCALCAYGYATGTGYALG